MKLPALFVALIVFALFTQTAFSQRYLPHVVMHDMAQRLYPVEAARVMAWMVNQKAAKTTEVRGTMASKQDGGGEWTLTWHSAGGEEMARSVVSYDAASLDGGAAHFRQGWKQMAAGFAFKVSAKPEKADAVSKAFWDGFSSADLSRMTAVMSLEKWSGRTQAPENAAQAAELAGRLARVARPVLAGACTLDHVCLARAAAWLCHAESLAGVELPREWAVISYLAGREIPASKAWAAAAVPAYKESPSWRWMDAVLTTYPMSLRDMCKLAVEPGMRDEGMLLMLGHARMEAGQVQALSNVISVLHRESIPRHADAVQVFMERFNFTSLRPASFLLGQLQLQEWLQAMSGQVQPGGDEVINQMAELAEPLINDLRRLRDPNEITSRVGSLVTLAAGHKPLMRPVAAVSAEDLVVHGWEITLVHWRQLYDFLDAKLGAPEEATKFAEAVKKHAPSLGFAMQRLDTKEARDNEKPSAWLEYLDEESLHRLLANEYNKPDPKTGKYLRFQGPLLHNFYMRGGGAYRHWMIAHGSSSLVAYGTRRAAKLLEQGGEGSASQALRFIEWQTSAPESLAKLSETELQIFSKIEAACPNAFYTQRRLLLRRLETEKADDLTQAAAIEKSYWQAPGYNDVGLVMELYLKGNAPTAAIRFYQQAREIGGDSVSFSNTEAPMRWAIAWWQKDAAGMQSAAKDSPSYSARDLEKHAIHEFCQPGHGKAAEVIRAYAERYRGAGSATAWLGEMLPVFDALKQAGHPKHEEAWQVLLQGDAHPHFQFLLLREAGISDAECAKRLQKASTSLASRAQGAYWRHMPEEFIQIQKEPSSGTQGKIHAMSRALLPLMEAELLKKPLVESLPDLKPAEEPRLEVMVQKLLQK